jgi:hypothetical protein
LKKRFYWKKSTRMSCAPHEPHGALNVVEGERAEGEADHRIGHHDETELEGSVGRRRGKLGVRGFGTGKGG